MKWTLDLRVDPVPKMSNELCDGEVVESNMPDMEDAEPWTIWAPLDVSRSPRAPVRLIGRQNRQPCTIWPAEDRDGRRFDLFIWNWTPMSAWPAIAVVRS